MRDVAEICYGATIFRYDGSDAMPSAVGAGSFWKEMTAWIGEQKSLGEALTDIDDSWPT